jgi:hypothetical protein
MHTTRHAAKLLFLAFLTIPQTLLHSTPPELSTRPPLAYEGFRNTVARESQDRSARATGLLDTLGAVWVLECCAPYTLERCRRIGAGK